MPKVDILAIRCKKCEKGFMYKSTLLDMDGDPAIFALVYSYHVNTIYFRGICSFCGTEFEASWILESLLIYPLIG